MPRIVETAEVCGRVEDSALVPTSRRSADPLLSNILLPYVLLYQVYAIQPPDAMLRADCSPRLGEPHFELASRRRHSWPVGPVVRRFFPVSILSRRVGIDMTVELAQATATCAHFPCFDSRRRTPTDALFSPTPQDCCRVYRVQDGCN